MASRRRPRAFVRWLIFAALLGGVALSFGVIEGDWFGAPVQTVNPAALRPYKAQIDTTLCDPNP